MMNMIRRQERLFLLASLLLALTTTTNFVVVDAYVVPNRPMAFATLTTNSLQQQKQQKQQIQKQQTSRYMSSSSAAAGGGGGGESASSSSSSSDSNEPVMTTFREAEVLGLRFMQEGKYQEALNVFQKGMKLPGSRADVVRTKSLSGPSPVGGSMGGFESQNVSPLDEFELQAAHYNIACAHAKLGNLNDSIANLQKSFENGFNNYSTVRGDPDLDPIKDEPDYKKLMDTYDGKGFNPFGFLGSKQQ